MSVTIRDVPEDARDEHARRAEREGRSLQQHLRALIVESAGRPTVDEWLDTVRAEVRANGGVRMGTADIVQLVRDARDER